MSHDIQGDPSEVDMCRQTMCPCITAILSHRLLASIAPPVTDVLETLCQMTRLTININDAVLLTNRGEPWAFNWFWYLVRINFCGLRKAKDFVKWICM